MRQPETGKRLCQTALSLVLILLMAACASGGLPLTRSDVPLPPGVVRYDGAIETPLDFFYVALDQAFNLEADTVDLQYLWMPQSVGWETIEAFYAQQFAGADWQPTTEPLPGVLAWTRPSNQGEQRLVITSLPYLEAEGRILVVVLVTD